VIVDFKSRGAIERLALTRFITKPTYKLKGRRFDLVCAPNNQRQSANPDSGLANEVNQNPNARTCNIIE
jgi:hypothetical protein